ncbi:Polyamine aminopropyltransferase [Tumidithrix helvetica PCC 7403]|uniref:spermine/spermidine synthase domain-containing protein n=1 Tax=Tumidithrix helvetica TaxID=3457545 RepID=UPI003C94745C
MPASLFIEHCPNGLAFYINGELQFHTEDEQIYHEYLVIPAISLAVKRFPQVPLRVLICGGGDGLAARDVLRFPEVSHIDLVDYNPDVLELGRTVFSAFNQNSLTNHKVTTHSQDAFEFLENIVTNAPSHDFYHVAICDFTYPSSDAETRVKSQEWYELLYQVLYPQGIVAENAVSPEKETLGFWCIYQTMWSAGLQPKPMVISIPSFHRHDYGKWGFFLASSGQPIAKSEILNAEFPNNLKTFSLENFLSTFIFERAIADQRTQVPIHSLANPQILYYLLNPLILDPSLDLTEKTLPDGTCNFLEISELDELMSVTRSLIWQDESERKELNADPLKLESLARHWLIQIQSSHPQMRSFLPSLLPVQHPYHTPKMTASWLQSTQQFIAQIDLPRLLQTILERGKALPNHIRNDLNQLLTKLKASDSGTSTEFKRDMQEFQRWEPQTTDQEFSTVPTTIAKLIAALSVTLLVANVIAPDSVFAKGTYYGGSGGSSNGDDLSPGLLGLFLTMGGVIWLICLVGDENS